jgi:cysteine desulfurase
VIYLDHNAGAPLLPAVAERLAEALVDAAANPSSVHRAGRRARRRLDEARERVARLLGTTPREIVFTGSGSEAAAIAVLGAFRARKARARRRVVVSAIEHPCVLGAADRLAADGADVVRVRPGADGRVREEDFAAALTEDTALASLQWVNNETGVLQPVEAISRLCAARGIVFHTDAVQAFGRVPASLREVPADLLSLSAHKLGGPAGIGALFVRRGVPLEGLTPGHQEDGKRGGTPSAAFAEALALALEHAAALDPTPVTRLRDRFEAGLLAALPEVRVNGAAPRVGNTSNLCFPGVDGEALLIALDLEGVCASSGAACASGTLKPSHVLLAMGLTPGEAHASLRFSFGPENTDADVTRTLELLTRLVPRHRESV